MMDLLHHRGPDGEGKYLSGAVGLGHRRLSIIDLRTGDQPMGNEDGTVQVVYNGEIYNFRELRAVLENRGHRFKSTTDTEVIVHLYEEVGEECVARLRGMFAFALWDARRRLLLLARDRVGIKPLYYVNTGRSLLFGSEIKAILADPSVKRRINPDAVDRFLTYHYLPGMETLLEGVLKLKPGYYMTVRGGEIEEHQYWDLEFPACPRRVGFDDAVAELRLLLRRTVKDHMISDVPVGVLLSGGVDSTGVLRYAVEQTTKPLHTFTIGFEGQQFADERPYARIAAWKYATQHREITITAQDFKDFLPKYVWHMEEPVCEPPAVALYFVSQLARQTGIKVLLSGEGGDEAFGGYQNYRNLLLLERMKSAFGPGRGLLKWGFDVLGWIGWRQVGRYARLVDLPMSEYYLSRSATPDSPFNRLKPFLYTADFAAAVDSGKSSSPTRRLFQKIDGRPSLDRMLYVDTKTWLPDDLLVKADKMTMATSVELRVPLLDYQLLEFAAALPQEYKVSGWRLKRILKAALADSVPREILSRRKTGFPIPYDRWLREDLREFAFDAIMGHNSGISSFFNMEKVEDILRSHQQQGAYSKEVFSLLVLELCHQVFISGRYGVYGR